MSRKVSVVGAGFSGLTAAFYLSRSGFDVEIYESSSRAGGLIETLDRPEGIVETAANGFLNSELVEELFEAVGVPLIGTKTEAKRRYIYRDGRFLKWPLGLGASLRLAWFVLRYFTVKTLVAPLKLESVKEWSCRVMGAEAHDYFIEPALKGIYAGDSSRLSAELIFARFFRSQDRSSLRRKLKGPHGSVSAPQGMGQLTRALAMYLSNRGVKFHYDVDIDLLTTKLNRDHPVIVATNPASAAHLLREVSPSKATTLRSIELSPVVTTTAFFETTDQRSVGFGVLFPRRTARRMLGVLKNNFIFAGRSRSLFSETWIMGGASTRAGDSADLISASDDLIIETIRQERESVFGLPSAPTASYITRWPFGIPHYTLELNAAIETLDRSEANIFLHGNYLGDLGLAKILGRSERLAARLTREGHWST